MLNKTRLLTVSLLVLLLTACGSSAQIAPSPTAVDVSALQTAAVQTVVAEITQTAAAQPSPLPTETSVPTLAAATETPVPQVSPTAALCDNSAFVSDASVPDNTQMTAGQDFVKTWKVKNTGTCTWTTGYQIIHAYGEKLGGLPTSLSSEVLPGSEVEISVNLKAATTTGVYSSYWRLANNNGSPFGQVLTVVISVP